MVAILSAVVSIFEFRFRGRASLELELVALRHQVTVLRRQRPGRPQLSSSTGCCGCGCAAPAHSLARREYRLRGRARGCDGGAREELAEAMVQLRRVRTAASDWAASCLAVAIERVAAALLAGEEMPGRRDALPSRVIRAPCVASPNAGTALRACFPDVR
jgi:hypothetical protein